MKTLFLLKMTVRVTATTTHRTVFIIVIKKEKKLSFIHLELFQKLKFSDYKKSWKLIFSEIFLVQSFMHLMCLVKVIVFKHL